jgi:ankyrin repeat protein
MAVVAGDRKTVLVLLESGADLEGRSSAGWTPLHFAADSGSLDMVKLLVERGADVNARTRAGLRPVQTAWEGRFAEIVTYLQRYDQKPLYDIVGE